ncbi:DUF3040 domain-containing protein [Pseudonocardia sp. GCM10023141]|uniref:DUF3040 domain-containing protein n=1 Tax=Pseudonocardia sp. GCM10023141 TaxID=3252653 RepID=UPI0036078421
MLSEPDRSALHDIEQRLEREDAALAAVLRRHGRAETWARHRHDITIAVSTVLALVCLFLPGATGAGLLAAALAAITFLIRRVRFPAGAGAKPTGQRGWRGGRVGGPWPDRRPPA